MVAIQNLYVLVFGLNQYQYLYKHTLVQVVHNSVSIDTDKYRYIYWNGLKVIL